MKLIPLFFVALLQVIVMATNVQISRVEADGISIFYRHAGSPSKPTILLLHGFPASSHTFRNLIPLLAEKYYVVAPDFPGFGFTDVPAARNYSYTFANLATTTGAFLDKLKIQKYSIYIFDYGAPVGFRLALQRPDAVTAIVSQNGNAYVEGLGPFWDNLRPLWATNSTEARAAATALLDYNTTKSQYTTGEPDEGAGVPPESYSMHFSIIPRPPQLFYLLYWYACLTWLTRNLQHSMRRFCSAQDRLRFRSISSTITALTLKCTRRGKST